MVSSKDEGYLARGCLVASSDQNEGFRMELIWSSSDSEATPVQLDFNHKILMSL